MRVEFYFVDGDQSFYRELDSVPMIGHAVTLSGPEGREGEVVAVCWGDLVDGQGVPLGTMVPFIELKEL